MEDVPYEGGLMIGRWRYSGCRRTETNCMDGVGMGEIYGGGRLDLSNMGKDG